MVEAQRENLPKRVEVEQDERSVSFELSDLEKQAVMDKMCDIATPGTAYTGLRDNNSIDRIFNEGLLGSVYDSEDDVMWGGVDAADMANSADGWAERLRKKRNSLIFFNISGRASFKDSGFEDNQISGPEMKYDDRNVFIVFDLDKFKERSGEAVVSNTHRQKANTYMKTLGGDREKTDARFGFALSYRVAPRFFKGVVIIDRPIRELTYDEVKAEFYKWLDEKYTVHHDVEWNGVCRQFYEPSFYKSIKYVTDEFIVAFMQKVVEIKNRDGLESISFFSDEGKELKSFAFQKIRDLINGIEENEYKYFNHGYDIYHDTSYDIDKDKGVLGGAALAEYVENVIRQLAGRNMVPENDPDKIRISFENLMKETLERMFSGVDGKRNKLVPIYDGDGNMLWPEQISHDEIVKVVSV